MTPPAAALREKFLNQGLKVQTVHNPAAGNETLLLYFPRKIIMPIHNLEKVNDVEGRFSHPALSSMDSYASQLTPDHHQDTVSKTDHKFKFGTWNVRTLMQRGKLENIKREMERAGAGLLGLSEVQWSRAGAVQSEN